MEKVFGESYSLPQLDIGDKCGHTDYIDFIRSNEVHYPVVAGVDRFKRPFFVVKAIGVTKDGKEVPFIQTFFQRYTDNDHLWMGCYAGDKEILETSGGMKDEHFKFIKKLCKGKIVERPERTNIDARKIQYFYLANFN